MDIEFTWLPEKAKRNVAKHNVSFETAKQVFLDPYVIVVDDCEDERGEMRYHAIGYADGSAGASAAARAELLLLVVFADRSGDGQEIIHIISARKADNYEQRTYARQFEAGN